MTPYNRRLTHTPDKRAPRDSSHLAVRGDGGSGGDDKGSGSGSGSGSGTKEECSYDDLLGEVVCVVVELVDDVVKRAPSDSNHLAARYEGGDGYGSDGGGYEGGGGDGGDGNGGGSGGNDCGDGDLIDLCLDLGLDLNL